jgi:hypothetical protein
VEPRCERSRVARGGFEADDSRALGDATYAGLGIGVRPAGECVGPKRLEGDRGVTAVQHARLPEYCAGISAVEVEETEGASRARVCHFRSPDGSGAGPALRERIRWESTNAGYATSAEPDNAFGISNSLSLVTVTAGPTGTMFTWEEYYDNADLPTARASFDDGITDIATRLIARLGGRIVERYVDGPR